MTEKLEALLLKEDVDIVKRLLTNKNIQDKWIWRFDKIDLYSIKSGYRACINHKIREASSSNCNMETTWKKLWNLIVPRKINFSDGEPFMILF